MEQTVTTRSEEETVEFGRQLAASLSVGSIVLLIGNLGAGKTTLAKGILSGLGVAAIEEVTSPTFTLIHEFGTSATRAPLAYHIDLYRLDTAEQVGSLGLDEILERDSVVLIEWGERFPGLWPDGRIEVRLEAAGEDRRRISVARISGNLEPA